MNEIKPSAIEQFRELGHTNVRPLTTSRLLTQEDLDHLEGDEVARQNSVALESLTAGQLFVEAGYNGIPGKVLEEGLPVVWRDKSVT